MRSLIADILVVAGLIVVTIGVYGVARWRDVFLQLHAASKAGVLGVALLLAAAAVEGDRATAARSLLAIALIGVTAPVGSHAIARAAARRRAQERRERAR
ncbi:MAG: monovalent cation/H(+) antiporter subunit G [Solirubrobacteraceae bacterium]|nr:monovalent cation/H(+) antiporter subunit G [Solirubrobacteraceae bacterium]